MSLLGARELLEFATRIEENGEHYYRMFAEKADSEDQRKLFENMAEEEIKHKKMFEALKEQVGNYQADNTEAQGYYEAYLRTYTEDYLCNKHRLLKDFSTVYNMETAIDFAMKQELDSLLFYSELKLFVPQNQEEIIEKIKNEERKHYTDLVILKRSYQGGKA